MQSFLEFLTEEDDPQRIDPTKFDIAGAFTSLNARLFGGKLTSIPVTWGKVPKGAAAITQGKALKNGPVRKTIPGSVSITVAPYTYILDSFLGILAHEMVHAYCMQFNLHERDAHGVYFRSELRKAQQHASFTIPMTHVSESEERGVAKFLTFIAGERDGKFSMYLYNLSLTNSPEAVMAGQSQVDRLVKDNRYTWAAFGIANTNHGNSQTVGRSITRTIKLYAVKSLADLNVRKIIHVVGPMPTHFS